LEYRRLLRFLDASQWESPQVLRMFQWGVMQRIIRYAYENTVYYRQVIDERGITPKNIYSPEDLRLLPILTKSDVRNHSTDMHVPSRRKPIAFSTSGSSGTPLHFGGTESMYKREAAFITRAFAAQGASLYNEKTVWLRRYVPQAGEPLWYEDQELNRLYLSAYHITHSNTYEYMERIFKYGARVLVGYPSSIYILALEIEKWGMPTYPIEIIHVASEKVLPHWGMKVKQIFGVPMKAHYGLNERVSMGFQCMCSDYYHECLEYGYTEYIPDEPGLHRVIATGFNNLLMPFIRYDTGDYAELNYGDQQCICGRGLPLTVKDYEGRSDDLLIAADGHYIPPVNFYTTMYKFSGVELFQIKQYAPSYVEVQLVAPHMEFEEECKLELALQERLGKNMDVEIRRVDRIKRSTETGKVRCIQRIF